MKDEHLVTIKDLKKYQGKFGLLFCFGTSFVSKIIQAKTRENKSEVVPSHVAIIAGNFLYESTSQSEKLGYKRIPAGVRRYLFKDFLRTEKKKNTLYYFYECPIDMELAEKYIHYPYGKDIIVDILFTDGSEGDSRGLICSQYGNLCAHIMDEPVVTPAELYRQVMELN